MILVVSVAAAAATSQAGAATFDLDFNSGVDSFGNSSGVLLFNGPAGFSVTFDDDGSGATNGVQFDLNGTGNKDDGPGDLELGANESNHSSGIVAVFSQGVTSVSMFDNDDDFTAKTFFAFDQFGVLLGQDGGSPYPGVPPGVFIDPADAQRTFTVDQTTTSGALIYSVEFDTLPGAQGGV